MINDIQIEQFGHELDMLINHFRDEYDVSYAAVIGALYRRIHLLNLEIDELNEEEDE